MFHKWISDIDPLSCFSRFSSSTSLLASLILAISTLGAISNVVEIGVLAIYSANDNIEEPAHHGNVISHFKPKEKV